MFTALAKYLICYAMCSCKTKVLQPKLEVPYAASDRNDEIPEN